MDQRPRKSNIHCADRQTDEQAEAVQSIQISLADYLARGGQILEVDYAATGEEDLNRRWDLYKTNNKDKRT